MTSAGALLTGALAAGAVAFLGRWAWRLHRIRTAPDARNLDQLAVRLAETLVREQQIPALAIGIIHGDRTCRIERGTALPLPDGAAHFEIGSLTKLVTMLAAARLVADGTWQWDQPIHDLLPPEARPDTDDGTTLRQLASHTAGYPRLPTSILATLADPNDPYAALALAAVWASVRTREEKRPPGRASEAYSNLGAGLLGHLLERQRGRSYESLVTELVLAPLGMHQTRITLDPGSGALVPALNEDGRTAHPWTFGALAGAGALRSTLPDMLRFLRAALQRDPVLGLDWAATWTAVRHPGGARAALAWQVGIPGSRLFGSPTIIWHNGGTGGFSSFLGFVPERGYGVVILAARAAYEAVDELGTQLLWCAARTSLGPDAEA